MTHSIKEKMELYTSSTKGKLDEIKDILSTPEKKYSVTEEISKSGWHVVNEVPLEKRMTSSGLLVYTPKFGDQCWDAPLPCTPYFKESLRLRRPGDMASGFTVNLQETFENSSKKDAALN